MRLFIAVNFSEEIKNRILALQEKLRSQASRGTFTVPQNLHLTLAFLGEVPVVAAEIPAATTAASAMDEKLELLSGIISDPFISGTLPFEIRFNHTGCFTHSGKELWWLGADKSCAGLPLIKALHERLLRLIPEEGFSVDKRPFSPHITLGRDIKHERPINLTIGPDDPEITVAVDRISLMKSEHLKGKLTYTELFGKDLYDQDSGGKDSGDKDPGHKDPGRS